MCMCTCTRIHMHMTVCAQVLNVSHASAQRFHSHVDLTCTGVMNASCVSDCLHWCLPGALDMWNVALQNELAQAPI